MRTWLRHKFTQKKCRKYFPLRFLLVTLDLVHYFLQDCVISAGSPVQVGHLCAAFIKTIKTLSIWMMIFCGFQLFSTVQWQQHEYFPSSNVSNYHSMKVIDNNKCRWIKNVMKMAWTLCASVSTQSNVMWCKLLHSSSTYCRIHSYWVFRSESNNVKTIQRISFFLILWKRVEKIFGMH